jgi:type II secretion system protein I
VQVPPRSTLNRDEGFTLIEVIVAMAVFAIVSLATVSILINALRTVRENEDRVLAANLARSALEQARIDGAAAIPIGLTEREVSDFTVRTSANWVGVDQRVSACDAITPGQDFLRFSVEVSGRTLSSPQRVDGVVPGIAPESARGALTIFAGDQYAEPLSDVTITGIDPFHPENSFQVVTGADGCVFLPFLTASGSLLVSVQRNVDGLSYITRTPEDASRQAQIAIDEVTRLSFELAPPAGVRFESDDAVYPVPEGVPASWKPLTTGAVTRVDPLATLIDGLWPATTGFEAWLGSCSDADPRIYGGTPTSFDLVGGGNVTVPVEAAKVRVKGLLPEMDVQIRYTGADPDCAGLVLDAGVADEEGRVDVLVPYGPWEFIADGQVRTPEGPLVPSPDRLVVAFEFEAPEEGDPDQVSDDTAGVDTPAVSP